MCRRSGTAGGGRPTRARRQELELRLSYSVKASADFGLLVLSMRAKSFHQPLYESMRLAGRAAAARMQKRPEAAISAGLTATESVERRTDKNRRVRYAIMVDRG